MNVSEIMTKEVVSVKESESVLVAADLLALHDFHGLPVVDENGTLVGLVTQSSLVTNTSHIHIPTLLALLKQFDLYRKDKKFIKKQLDNLEALKVADVMMTEPPLIYEGQSVDTAIMHLSRVQGISPLSVVTLNRKLSGVVSRSDVIRNQTGEKTAPPKGAPPTIVDQKIESFLGDFERQFLFISRLRTRAWLLFNLAFLVVGIAIAIALFW